MSIKGFQGTSLLDFPGRIASLIFFGRCNLSCGFCHNPALVLAPDDFPDIPAAELLAELAARRNFIDGVVISGGEPTLDPDLPRLLGEIKALGLLVKLDTNGLLPGVLERLLSDRLVDYVALDLKTAPARYDELHSAPVASANLLASLRLLLAAPIDYELRTTCVPGLVEAADLHALGEQARGARRWFLQQFVPHHALAPELQALSPHAPATLQEFARIISAYAVATGIRGL
ncbi:anaerobic ribonucleoside-triphosphate reductase activating protein [Desulfuromonas carbonis]